MLQSFRICCRVQNINFTNRFRFCFHSPFATKSLERISNVTMSDASWRQAVYISETIARLINSGLPFLGTFSRCQFCSTFVCKKIEESLLK